MNLDREWYLNVEEIASPGQACFSDHHWQMVRREAVHLVQRFESHLSHDFNRLYDRVLGTVYIEIVLRPASQVSRKVRTLRQPLEHKVINPLFVEATIDDGT